MIVFAPHAAFAAVQDVPHESMRLELLEHVVHRELHAPRLEARDKTDRHHVVAHRVDEGAAELAVARERSGQPSVCTILRSGRGTRHLLHAERPDLRVLPSSRKWSIAALVSRPCVPSASTVTPATTSDPGSNVVNASPCRPPAVAGSHAEDASVLDEQLLRGGLRENGHA